MKRKLTLESLSVMSFITELSPKKELTVKGGCPEETAAPSEMVCTGHAFGMCRQVP